MAYQVEELQRIDRIVGLGSDYKQGLDERDSVEGHKVRPS